MADKPLATGRESPRTKFADINDSDLSSEKSSGDDQSLQDKTSPKSNSSQSDAFLTT